MHFMSSYDSHQNMFRHVKRKEKKKKRGVKKKLINSKSYWQTTQWNIRRILKSLFFPTGNHYHFLVFGIPTAYLETTKPRATQHNNCSSLSTHTS